MRNLRDSLLLRTLGGRAPGGTPLLDAVPGAAVAYSGRALSSTYTGPVARLRNTATQAEADYAAGAVPVSGHAYRTLYDQSGNARHGQQATAASQPLASAAGPLYDGTDDFLQATGFTVSQPDTVAVVCRFDAAVFRAAFDGAAAFHYLLSNDAATSQMYAGTALNGTAAGSTLALFVAHFNGASSWLRRNGVVVATGSTGANALSGLRLGRASNGNAPLLGALPEIAVYSGALSAGALAALEANIMAHYSIAP